MPPVRSIPSFQICGVRRIYETEVLRISSFRGFIQVDCVGEGGRNGVVSEGFVEVGVGAVVVEVQAELICCSVISEGTSQCECHVLAYFDVFGDI